MEVGWLPPVYVQVLLTPREAQVLKRIVGGIRLDEDNPVHDIHSRLYTLLGSLGLESTPDILVKERMAIRKREE